MNQQQTTQKFSRRSDACYLNQNNKSIFDYVTDTSMFVNKNQCLDVTPPFLSYIPVGIPNQNVDIENDLRGILHNNTRCASCKYHPKDVDTLGHNLSVCKPEYQILPNGYYYNSTRSNSTNN